MLDPTRAPAAPRTSLSSLVRHRADLLLLAFAVGLAGCAGEYPQSTIDPTTEFADAIHSLYVSVFWWTMLILVVVWALLAYVLVRFRAREGDPLPKQIRGHLGIEIVWTVVPALIVLAIAIPTIRTVFATQQHLEDGALVVEVTGYRFWWEFHYPETGVRTANELHLPVGRPVNLRLAARDVVHSFWVPMLGGKRDVNPLVARPEHDEEGEPRYNWLHFTPRETGVYMGQCAEYCGEAHALMGLRVVVEEETEFEAWSARWIAGDVGAAPPAPPPPADTATSTTADPSVGPAPPQLPAEDPLVTRGREVFLAETTCAACHAISGTFAQGRVGPDLTLFGNRTTIGAGRLENTPENLARWIRDPQGVKSGAEMPGADYALEGGTGLVPAWPATALNDEQIAAIAAYLRSLR